MNRRIYVANKKAIMHSVFFDNSLYDVPLYILVEELTKLRAKYGDEAWLDYDADCGNILCYYQHLSKEDLEKAKEEERESERKRLIQRIQSSEDVIRNMQKEIAQLNERLFNT